MTKPRCRISVMGMGFVGLSLAVANAKAGFETVGVDTDVRRIDCLKEGKPGFFEPDLEVMLADSIKQNMIRFTTDLDDAVRSSEITFLAVGTPQNSGGEDEVDLSCVRNAIGQIALSLRDKKTFHLVAVKSTLPPLTAQTVILPAFGELIDDGRMDVVVNPEFLREGSAIADVLRPHLVVIGSNGEQGRRAMEEYCMDFYGTQTEMMHTDIVTAEIIKYANNAFLATKISFINSIGALCQRIPGVDVETVAHAIGKDPRIGSLFLKAGPGFGGSCLPKDLSGLIGVSQEVGASPDFFRAVRTINERQLMAVIDMVDRQGALKEGKTVAVLGLAFKAGTDDIREAVSVRLVERLLQHGLNVRVHDPIAMENFKRIFGTRVSYCPSASQCLEGSDCCVILTDWDEYKGLRPRDFLEQMGSCKVIDAKRALDAKEFQGTGFMAMGLGD